MKKLFTGKYTLDVPTRTIILMGVALRPEQVLMITNVTAGHVYHMFTSEIPANISVVGGDTRIVFQPFKDCETHSNTDRLSIYIDDGRLNSTVELIGTYTFTDRTDPIDLTGFLAGSVFMAHCKWDGSANDVIEIRRISGVPGLPGTTLLNPPVTFYRSDTQEALTTVGSGVYSGEIIFRHPTANTFEGVVFNRVSGNGGVKTLKLFVLGELSYGTGYPHINVSTLVLDNNLKVSGPLTNTELRASAVSVSGPLTNTELRNSPVPVYGEQFKTLANWSWPVSGEGFSPALALNGLQGSVLRITGDWNGQGGAKTYRLVRAITPSGTGATNQQVQEWTSGTVIPAGTATETGDFYYRVPSDLSNLEFLMFLKVSGNDVGTATATISLYEKPDILNQGRLVVLSNPLTNEELRASDVSARGSHGDITTVSGELTASNSIEVLAASGSSSPPTTRRYLFIQNLSTAPIYVNFTNAATATSMRLDAGSSLSFEGNFIPSNSVNLLRSTSTNQRYFLMHATF